MYLRVCLSERVYSFSGYLLGTKDAVSLRRVLAYYLYREYEEKQDMRAEVELYIYSEESEGLAAVHFQHPRSSAIEYVIVNIL